jgi:hypothetical protein
MAGKSSRFFKAGYKQPKYMLPLGNESCVFDEAIKSFKKYFKSDLFLFIIREGKEIKDFVTKQCVDLGIETYEIIVLDHDTSGQAETVFLGIDKSKLIDPNDDVYIFNIDSIRLNFEKPNKDFLNNIGGYLEVFKGKGDHWSFALPEEDNFVSKTTEKIRISDLCSNGLYYFSSANLFVETYYDFGDVNNYNEFFIAPMYNIMIERGIRVKYKLIETNATLFSGVPSEYESLLNFF